jgi:glycogen debranching enzyme
MRLKENTLYTVADPNGAMLGGEHGLYKRDTRFLSHLEWRVAGEAFTVLATHSPVPYRFIQHATEGSLRATQRLEIRREGWLDGASYHEHLRFTPHGSLGAGSGEWGLPVADIRSLELHLAADFADLFEVRGLPPIAHVIESQAIAGGVAFWCQGQDDCLRRVEIKLSLLGEYQLGAAVTSAHGSAPTWAADHLVGESEWSPAGTVIVRWQLPDTPLDLRLEVALLEDGQPSSSLSLDELARSYRDWRAESAIYIENQAVQRVFDQAGDDLRALMFDTPNGMLPAAGIPWFVAPFGRDSLWVALMTLPWFPQIAKGVLGYLASHQGQVLNPKNLEAPGKILHEQRVGEASRMGRTPFQTYYGSVDATPLWVCLLGEYFEWTNDQETINHLRPHFEAALAWLASSDADPDQDGFIEYSPHQGGISNQVWKDSGDSTFDAAGRELNAPIAVVEVQGYLYRAYLVAAKLYDLWQEAGLAAHYRERAERLQAQFQAAFWLAEGYYAHALDGDKRPAKVKTSNPGHCLWAGIVPAPLARQVAESLFSSAMWSGWGVRTLAAGEPRFNPVSYHNGSVWPHDNAVLALGLARYGLGDYAHKLAQSQLEAATAAADARLPELFAGFGREQDGGSAPPVPYPAACHPQAWDAAAPFAYLRAVLGLQPGRSGQRNHLPAAWGSLRGSAKYQGKPLNLL